MDDWQTMKGNLDRSKKAIAQWYSANKESVATKIAKKKEELKSLQKDEELTRWKK